MTTESIAPVVGVDDHVDTTISECLNLDAPTSFFLFAGAGSGKTRSLVTAVRRLLHKSGERLRLRGQQVGIITYTNAASDEIVRRLNFHPAVHVATIHSFVWDLIKGFDADIRIWVEGNLHEQIAQLTADQRSGRPGTKASADRVRSIESKRKRLDLLRLVKRFVYSPTGVNRGRDYLNHAEVLQIGADFISNRPLMQKLLISRYPVLLIDESQDTNRHLMESLLSAEKVHSGRFVLGLFGDTMQRIYTDGKTDLGRDLPSRWATPAKKMNYRSPHRVVQLINRIRKPVDGQEQQAASDAPSGHVRLFIHRQTEDVEIEATARTRMAELTGDELWCRPDKVKTLILEHHMAAKRLNFAELFDPLYSAESLRTSLLEGTLPTLRFFSDVILPLVDARRGGNEFAVAAIVRKESPLLRSETLRDPSVHQIQQLRDASAAVQSLSSLWDRPREPSFLEVLQSLAASGLLEVPESLIPFVASPAPDSDAPEADGDTGEVVTALRKFLESSFEQIRQYSAYVSRQTGFDTHQGVKGLEFPRVLVVMDDKEARGFSFNYEKLFGAQARTGKDAENERAGKETGIDRTRRLLYVTCSRAEKSLALVARSTNPDLVRRHALAQGWFTEDEIVSLD